jgi:arylsulfatase
MLTTKPNVLFIIADQLRADFIDGANRPTITPNLDRLRAESACFSRAYTVSPQCQPSRASLWTGRYPMAHKLWYNGAKLSPRERTIGNHFRDSQYATAYFGKLHLSPRDDHASSTHFGFDHAYLQDDWMQRALAGQPDQVSAAREFSAGLRNNGFIGSCTHEIHHHDHMIVDHAVRFLSGSPQPYFAVVSFHGPHPPYMAPDRLLLPYFNCEFQVPAETVQNLPPHDMKAIDWLEVKRRYTAAINWIDELVGKLLAVVTDDTIVVFLSDHGDILGDHGMLSKGLFAYEPVIRIPLSIRGPGLAPTDNHELVQSIDVAPTLLDLCGLPPAHHMQGRSMLPLLSGQRINHRIVSAIGTDEYKLRMVANKRFKYWCDDQGQEWLFDLEHDRDEQHNLAAHSQRILSVMRMQLIQALMQAEDYTIIDG